MAGCVIGLVCWDFSLDPLVSPWKSIAYPPLYWGGVTFSFFTLTHHPLLASYAKNRHGGAGAFILSTLIIIHILGAAQHALWDRDRVLETMLGEYDSI